MRRLLFSTIMILSVCAFAATQDTQTIQLDGSQLEQNITLNAEKMKTEYKSESVPDTCYRDVQKGTRQECYTPTHQSCHSASHQECGYEQVQKCGYGPSTQDCDYGPSTQDCGYGPDRQDCGYGPSTRECKVVSGPDICKTTYSTECKDERDCKVVNGVRECRTHEVCVQVPHESCRPGPDTRECNDVPGSYTCHTVPGEYSCKTVRGDYECHTVPGKYECNYENGPYKCETVRDPDECVTVSDPQVCKTVPNMVEEAYACTKTIRVPYEVKDFDVQAKVRVLLAQLPNGVKISEKLNLALVQDQFTFNLGDTTGTPDNKTIWFADKNLTENKAGNLKTIEALLKLTPLPVDALLAPVKDKLKVELNAEILRVEMPTPAYPELYKVTFDLLKSKTLFSKEAHVSKTVALADLVLQSANGRSVASVELKDLGLAKESRKSGNYVITVTLEGFIDTKNVVNPSAVPTSIKNTGTQKVKIK